jgi:hypothetical protein
MKENPPKKKIVVKKADTTIRESDLIMDWANRYIDYCLDSTKEVATGAGVRIIRERHLPTISYFLLIWLPRQGEEFYKRSHWYNIMKNSDHPLHKEVNQIDEMFRALAADIVANEGKGIFYAKNLLGWRAKNEEKQEVIISFANEDHTS